MNTTLAGMQGIPVITRLEFSMNEREGVEQ